MLSRTHIVAFFLSLVVVALLTPLVRRLAHRYALYDAPLGSRKVHRKPVPRLGGIAIAIGFFVPLAGLLVYENTIAEAFASNVSHVVGLFVCGPLVMLLGVLDDVRGMRAVVKLAGQVVIASVAYQFGFQIELLAIPFVGPTDLGMLAFPATVVWFVAVMNIVNLVDGLDGLAGGVAFFAVAAMFVVGTLDGNSLTTLFSATLAGAIIGFLFYNFNPATIFMGDSGSLFLGFVIAAVAVKTNTKSNTAIALAVPMVALGLPIVDAMLAVLRRLRRGSSVFAADKEHIHHRLLALGLTQRQAVLLLYSLCVGLAAVAISLKSASDLTIGVVIVGVILLFYGLSRVFRMQEMLHRKRMSMLLEDELLLPQDARVTLRGIGGRIRAAEGVEHVWAAVKEAASLLGVPAVHLRFYVRRDPGERIQQTYRFASEDELNSNTLFHRTVEIPLVGSSFLYGELTFTYIGSDRPDVSERVILMHMLSEYVTEFIETRMLKEHRERFVVSRLSTKARTSNA